MIHSKFSLFIVITFEIYILIGKENSLTDGSITSFKNETDSLIDTISIDPLLIVPSYGSK